MFRLLAKLFIRNCDSYHDPAVRRAYGVLCALYAALLNLVLVGAKLLAAELSGSFSIRADAWNNLTDAVSSLVLLLAFRLSGMKPRPDRPFGHGRIEYVAGLAVSWFIIFFGIELGRDSVKLIMHPEKLAASPAVFAVLVVSILVKCYMCAVASGTGKKINSETLKAMGIDSLSDTIATFGALAAILIYQFTPNHLNLDGIFGLMVSILIIKAGVSAAKDTLLQLLGTKPKPELVKQICDVCRNHKEVIGLHDLVVHDYGPGRLHVSVHCEVPGAGNIYDLHDAMDHIMKELDEKIGCLSVIHMDPVRTEDENINRMRRELVSELTKWHSGVMIHDFRVVGQNGTLNVLFDCVVPFEAEPDDEKAEKEVKALVRKLWPNGNAIVEIDRLYS